MAKPEQREAAGTGEERGEYHFQPGHPLCQPHGILASSFGHQQKQAASQHARSRLGEWKQQHSHQQVSRERKEVGSLSRVDTLFCFSGALQ